MLRLARFHCIYVCHVFVFLCVCCLFVCVCVCVCVCTIYSILTSLHECLPLINVVCREVILTKELLVSEQRCQSCAQTEQCGRTHQHNECRIVEIKITREPWNQHRVTGSLRKWEREETDKDVCVICEALFYSHLRMQSAVYHQLWCCPH